MENVVQENEKAISGAIKIDEVISKVFNFGG